ncbi:unnamed protein product [Ostreobium quekettii]|uniref:Electron transfer flavoprotein-ubiquinone oxidoreductase n=1 Tax=Ostreobium quekettii TaxID=121088 RepID=A0A8S1J3P0_9CHLO|nr:unnamed protein product [Ostreobium quekettii]
MSYDVCVVGAGPAGLSAAIKIKQLAKEGDQDISVCVVEKGAEVGAHIISGNVLDPRSLVELFPNWKEESAPLRTEAKHDRAYMLTKNRAWRMPVPPQMRNKGNYIISLSELCRWMAGRAEDLGVEVYTGFAGRAMLYNPDGSVGGILTNDAGVAKDGSAKAGYMAGVELRAKATLLAEGCRGSLSQEVIKTYKLREEEGADPQTYALGIKEMWEVPALNHREGTVWHTLGYPLDSQTYGGGFMYHMAENRVSVGFVVGLDYRNPYISPYQEFQKFKLHPAIKKVLAGGTCVQYGARALNEGGVQSIPKLNFAGGALIGCSAGFMNVPRIKGTHTAMKSGILAGEAVVSALKKENPGPLDLASYPAAMKESWVWDELHAVRNIRAVFRHGKWLGLAHAGLDLFLLRGSVPWTMRHRREDHEATQPAADFAPIQYPKPDNEITFDIPSSLYRSGTNHEHDQPPHLKLLNTGIPEVVNKAIYNGPESRYCPAGVYDYVDDGSGHEALQISAQNCLHCKACDIKDPAQNIKWTTPEGGGGPGYTCM